MTDVAELTAAEKAQNVQRVARMCFFAFILLQTPCLMIETPEAASKVSMVSPLQVAMGSLLIRMPEASDFAHLMLFPGTWVKEALVPYLMCLYQTPGQCEQDSLLDTMTVFRANKLALLVDLVSGITKGRIYVEVGCAVISIAGFASLAAPIKMATLGFVVLGWGLYQSKIVPLPPGVLLAFLSSYSGFNSIKQDKDDGERMKETLGKQQALLESAVQLGKEGKGAEAKRASPKTKARTNKHKA